MPADYDYDQLFPGRFLKAGEFQGKEATLTIKGLDLEEMEDRKGVKTKCIVTFVETKKQLVLNKTNGECLKGLWGRKTSAWLGKRVTFFPATVEAFGAQTLAIRVRGSPDLDSDKSIVCRIGRQGEVQVTMKRTGKAAHKGNGKASPTPALPAPAAAPIPVTTHGEPPPEVELPGGDVGDLFPDAVEADVPL